MNNIKLICGRSNLKLDKKISQKLNISLSKINLDDFPNTELKIEIDENIRGYKIFILQTGSSDEYHTVNDYLIELFSIIDACKRSNAKSINCLLPCYPYARSDKKDTGRVPINSSLIINILKNLGIKRIVSVDLHSAQIQGFIDIAFDNLYAIKLHIEKLNSLYFNNLSKKDINEQFILISPDNGGLKRVEDFAKRLEMDFITMHKHRDYSKKSYVIDSLLIGEESKLVGKIGIIIDDMVDTMGTIISAIKELESYGIIKVIVVATHGYFSGEALDRINNCDIIKSVIVTNSLPQKKNCTKCNKIIVVDMSDLFATVITSLTTGDSISKLF